MFSANILPITNFIWIFACTVKLVNTQNVYIDNYSSCQYNISKKIVEFQNFTETATYGSLRIYYNLCNGLIGVNGCDNAARVCILKSDSKFIPNAGNNFISNEKNQLLSFGSTNCINSTYKTIINFDIDHKEKKTFLIKGCDIIITVNPSSSCSVNFHGFELNLSPLSLVEDISVKGDSTYSLGICNYSSMCGIPYTGCNLDTKENFTSLETQTILYDYDENKVIVKGKVGKKKHSQIHINCNWFETVGKPQKLNKKYEFAIESRYGCVKLPTNCTVTKKDRYLYNLSNLNRPSGWKINIPEGTVTINVCGPLEQHEKTECSDIYSQVCLKTDRSNIGYGSLANPLRILDQGLQMDILYGSKCPKNITELLKTRVTFECSYSEEGPRILNTTETCMYHILWKTPVACPKDLEKENFDYTGENAKQRAIDCRVGDFYNLNPLVFNTGNYNVTDDSGNVFYINLCRPLFINKDTFACKGTAACMNNIDDINEETKYSAFGSPKVPQLIDDNLIVTYNGGWFERFAREIEIRFECSRDVENKIIFNKKTNSKIEFIWKTALVCKKALFECHEIFNFDKISNRQIVVKTGLLKYNFNLCDSTYSTITLSTGQELQHNAMTSLTYSQNMYTLKYQLTNSSVCDDLSKLNTVYLDFACNRRATDYYEEESVDNCVLHMKFWTSQACNNDSIYEETVANKKVISERNSSIKPNCSINFHDIESLDLDSLNPIKVVSKNGNVYEIANKTSICGDFICKNNKTAGSTSTVCPSMVIDILSQNIQMNFIGSICNKEMYKVTLHYKCKESQSDLPKVLSENACTTLIEVPDDLVCKKLQLNMTSNGISNAGLISGIVILCLIIVPVIGFLVWQYLRRNNYITLDKSKVYLRWLIACSEVILPTIFLMFNVIKNTRNHLKDRSHKKKRD